MYHWGQNHYIPFLGMGNYFRQLLQESLEHNIPGGIINVMEGLVLVFLGNHENCGYSYIYSLGAV